MCRWIYWNLKWPPQVDFLTMLNFCDRKNSNLIYDEGWYRTPGLLLIQGTPWYDIIIFWIFFYEAVYVQIMI